MNEALRALDALQEVDSALLKLARKLRSLDDGGSEKQRALEIQEAHAAAAKELTEARAALRDAELELKSVEAKKKDHADKLYSGKVTNPKELDAMQHEIEALGRRRTALDEQILQMMERVETVAKTEADLSAKLQEATGAHSTKSENYARAAKEIRTEAARLKTLRTERAAAVPAPMLKRYDSIRAVKDGVGISCIQDGRCGACRTTLPRNTVLSVRDSDAVVTCEACGRMLCVRAH